MKYAKNPRLVARNFKLGGSGVAWVRRVPDATGDLPVVESDAEGRQHGGTQRGRGLELGHATPHAHQASWPDGKSFVLASGSAYSRDERFGPAPRSADRVVTLSAP